MNRRWAACLLAGILTACSPSGGILPGGDGQTAAEEGVSLTLLLDAQTELTVQQAAEAFAQDVETISDYALTVTTQTVEDAVSAYQAGEGDLVFVDAREDSGFCEEMELLAEPVLYDSYTAFSMALNSERMLDLLNEELAAQKSQVMAAYYTGSNLLVTGRSVGGRMNLSQLTVDVPDGETGKIAMPEDTVITRQMEAFGLDAVFVPDARTRLDAVREGEAVMAEFAPDELAALTVPADWCVIYSVHDLSPLWLVLRSDVLDDQQQMALREAAAYLFPEIDGQYRDAEDALFAEMKKRGVTVSETFPSFHENANRQISSDWGEQRRTQYMYWIINSME